MAGRESHSIFPCGHVFLNNLLNNTYGCNQMLPEDGYIIINHGEEPVSHSSFARIILSNMQDIHLD